MGNPKKNIKKTWEDLSDMQKKFAREYLRDSNQTAAAIRCGFSRDSARQSGTYCYNHPAIRAEINRLQKKRAKRLEITEEKVLNELAKIAFVDLSEFFNEDKTPIHPKDLDNLQSACVSEFEVNEDDDTKVKRIKLHCKMNAIEKICKKLGFGKDSESSIQTVINIIRASGK